MSKKSKLNSNNIAPIKFLAHVHGYSGVHNAGAERYLEAILEFLAAKGHKCTVLTSSTMGVDGSSSNGVTINTKASDPLEVEKLYKEYDYILTHLDNTTQVIGLCRTHNKKLIYIVHNFHSIPYWQVKVPDCWMVMYNAEWIKKHHEEKINFLHSNNFTLIPPTNFDKFNFKPEETREDITLVNLNPNKGVLQFIMLAKLLPEYSFRGVVGAYGDQVIGHLPKNVTLVKHTKDIVGEVYKHTKILLMPSLNETWGMAAIESMCSGIPVIAHPTEGLLEACAGAGLFALRDKAYVWRDLIIKLMEDSNYYSYWSNKSLERATEVYIKAYSQLEDLEKRLVDGLK